MSAEGSWKGREVDSPEDTHPEGRLEGAGTDCVCSTVSDGVSLTQGTITEMVQSAERQAEEAWAWAAGGLDSVGRLFEECIEAVSLLEAEREMLVQECLRLQQQRLQAVEALRAERGRGQQLLSLVQLSHAGLQEQVAQVKRRLFVTTRDCIQSQVTLAALQYDVAEFMLTQEELQSQVQSLAEEAVQLREAQQQQLTFLRDQARRPSRPRASSDLSHVRRASLALQRRLSGSMRALEGWYEPRLLALLRRRQAGEEALRRTREAGGDLEARLGPLREETWRLQLQRACLEERMVLRKREREESVAQQKEIVETLEDTVRDLKLELEVLKKSKTNMEKVTSDLLREVDFQRRGGDVCETTEEQDA
ncbi:syncoilin-like [Osmerus eperlanus]|uniref:syncoilin-like n=1 Tax=Osmerus eperlanus TaxID=29151 RepID=UPI002E160D67